MRTTLGNANMELHVIKWNGEGNLNLLLNYADRNFTRIFLSVSSGESSPSRAAETENELEADSLLIQTPLVFWMR